MTPIQLLLLFLLVSIGVFVALQQVTRLYFKVFLLSFLCLGGVFVLAPGAANAVANMIGVGRGADLVLYFFAILSTVMFFLIFMKTTLINRDITSLVRSLALSQARWPGQKRKE
jgi:small membrane protein